VTCKLIHHINFNVMFNVNVIFIPYFRLVILLLRAGRHGKILIEKRRRDSEKFGNHWSSASQNVSLFPQMIHI
jgi:hypothetical protein